MAKQERYTIGPGLLRDIRSTIQKVNAIASHTSGPTQGVRYWDMQRPLNVLRLGAISATWNKGASATVTQQKGDGTVISGGPTFTANNYFANITVPSGQTRRVACALVDGTWFVIAAEC